MDMGRGDGVEGTADVQKYRKAVRAAINVSLNIVRKHGGSSLCGFVAAEAVLLRMERGDTDTLLDMPRAMVQVAVVVHAKACTNSL